MGALAALPIVVIFILYMLHDTNKRMGKKDDSITSKSASLGKKTGDVIEDASQNLKDFFKNV